MKRRTLLATLLSAPALLPSVARASEDDTPKPIWGRFGFFQNGDLVRPNWVLIGSGNRPLAWDLRPETREFPAETLNRLPVLGGLFRAPPEARLVEATPLGTVHLYGGNLVLPQETMPTRAAIVHQRTEWAYAKRPRRVGLNTPLVANMFSGHGVGSGYLTTEAELIILIRPTIVASPD